MKLILMMFIELYNDALIMQVLESTFLLLINLLTLSHSYFSIADL